MITYLKIENIKGFSTTNNSFNLEIKPQKINILVAPNGFGKSSISIAFNSLIRGKIKVEENNLHQKNNTLVPSLSLTLDGINLIANPTTNTISSKLTCCTINNRLKVQTISKTYNGYTTTKGFLSIDSVPIVDSIPEKVSELYRYSDVKSNFGINGKVLPNLSDLFSKKSFLENIQNGFDIFEKFETIKRSTLIDDVKAKIKDINGSKEVIISRILDAFFTDLENDDFYKNFGELFNDVLGESLFEKFSLFYQLRFLYKSKKENLLKASRRASYDIFKEKFDLNIQHINTTWKDLKSKKEGNALIIEFPHADEVSNGQRDILTFIAQLIKFQSNLKRGKKYLLIIDEVFDYLDDANVIAAQYYISNLLKDENYEIYPIIFTHLDPKYFRNYIFKPSLLNVQYLKKVNAVGSESMKNFITYREGLDKNNTREKSLYDDLSKYFFHYCPNTIDRSADIPIRPNLKKTWAKDTYLKEYVLDELNKYFSAAIQYDPYAVSLGIRYRIEKVMYDSFADSNEKEEFINTHQTDKKLKYAEEHSALVPDAYYYLSAIHNEAEHLKQPNEEKACVYKLNHPVIRNIILELFDNSNSITINMIH
ncbi:MAG TPA: hypothetical protein PKA78_05475 [Macellibacteroides fermentans]|uniref:hypothetical protein n=1 Tax=Macellibacteroides fermentans TaxID=879969 RepID=UPI002B98BA38|nr:hypothetical protein [Macellibacteroides fermentans]